MIFSKKDGRKATESLKDGAELVLKDQQLSKLESGSIPANIYKLNLSKNALTNESIAALKQNTMLTWLNLNSNNMNSMEGFEYLNNLLVLNLSANKITRMTVHLQSCLCLKALILNNNEIEFIDNISSLTNLSTLVLSHNKIEQVSGLSTLENLVKLSIAHNLIKTLPDLSKNTLLKELRFNNNKIKKVPEELIKYFPIGIEIIDLGCNDIKSFKDILGLATLSELVNLNLKGNPICKEESYRNRILVLIPSLRILDGERFDVKFLERREKKNGYEMKKKLKVKKREWLEKGGVPKEFSRDNLGDVNGKKRRDREQDEPIVTAKKQKSIPSKETDDFPETLKSLKSTETTIKQHKKSDKQPKDSVTAIKTSQFGDIKESSLKTKCKKVVVKEVKLKVEDDTFFLPAPVKTPTTPKLVKPVKFNSNASIKQVKFVVNDTSNVPELTFSTLAKANKEKEETEIASLKQNGSASGIVQIINVSDKVAGKGRRIHAPITVFTPLLLEPAVSAISEGRLASAWD